MPGPLPDLDAQSFEQFVSGNGVAVVDFWAPWCGPCHRLTPVVEELSKELTGKVAFAKLNTDEAPAVAMRFGVMSIPTIIVFKGGKVADTIVGAWPKRDLLKKIEPHMT